MQWSHVFGSRDGRGERVKVLRPPVSEVSLGLDEQKIQTVRGRHSAYRLVLYVQIMYMLMYNSCTYLCATYVYNYVCSGAELHQFIEIGGLTEQEVDARRELVGPNRIHVEVPSMFKALVK